MGERTTWATWALVTVLASVAATVGGVARAASPGATTDAATTVPAASELVPTTIAGPLAAAAPSGAAAPVGSNPDVTPVGADQTIDIGAPPLVLHRPPASPSVTAPTVTVDPFTLFPRVTIPAAGVPAGVATTADQPAARGSVNAADPSALPVADLPATSPAVGGATVAVDVPAALPATR